MKASNPIIKLFRQLQGEPRIQRRKRSLLRRLQLESLEERRVLATIDLAALTAPVGATIFGADAGDYSGSSVSNAGDVNGDGFDDLIIGSNGADSTSNAISNAGESYVIFGSSTFPATIDLANLGSAGLVIFGVDALDYSGFSVSSAGDVNGDGFDDLVVGATAADASGNAKSLAGDSYLIFGGSSLPSTIQLSSLGSAGITFFGADIGDRSGTSISAAGDVNGDGFDDVILGAYRADALGNTKTSCGDSYLIFGGVALPATINLATLGTVGVTISGAEGGDYSGRSVSSAGDINGDGFDDLVIGAFGADASGNSRSQAGDSYILFGASVFPLALDLSNLGSGGMTIFGAESSDQSGFAVSGAGDVNGDGFDDIIIGARYADATANLKSNAGESYLIFGGTSLPATLDLAAIGSSGVTFLGATTDDRSGFSVSHAGDVNGDGFDDLLIGSQNGDAAGDAKYGAGESYVIFGSPTLASTIDLAGLNAGGITIFGAETVDRSGRSVSYAGDVNGDGFDDIIIGAFLADAFGNFKSSAGESYVIFGSNSFTNSILPSNLGTSAADVINGTSAAQVINGADGDDSLVGNGGADTLLGGRGNDMLVVSDLSFQRINGGTGIDTLKLDGSGLSLNMSVVRDNRLFGIEAIDITGTGNNTLVLNQLEILNASNESNKLTVVGDSGDRVLMDNGWSRGADQGGFQVFSKQTARLEVSIGVTIGIAPFLDLANPGSGATILFGADPVDISGVSVSNAGDVNGDGFDDFIIGASSGDVSGNTKVDAGESYVIFGGPSLPTIIDLANLGSSGITIFGAESNDFSGSSVGSAGDMNGDGFDDLIIGAWRAGAAGNAKFLAGENYVIFGGASLPATVNVANLGSAGVTIFGADSGDRSGLTSKSAGDVNGDGFDDVIIGAYGGDALGNAKSNAGDSYLIFGGASLPSTIDLANLASGGVTIFGANSGDLSGGRVNSAGDINGDGFDDLLISAVNADGALATQLDAGVTYIIFGGQSMPSTIDLLTLGADGIRILGIDLEDISGRSVSGIGDMNGDGFDDVVIGATRADALGNAKPSAGESYVIFGGSSLPATIDLASLGAAGITIYGADVGDLSGNSLSGAGDINGDGFNDLLIGAYLADASLNSKLNAGESYVVFGGMTLPTTIDLANMVPAGLTIYGVNAFDQCGVSVSTAGDVNGDGFDDIIIGASQADSLGNTKDRAGDSYVIFGDNFTSSVTLQGTIAGETLNGTSAANIINGARGSDVLVGNGGGDVLMGGQGDDTLAVSDLTFRRIIGGLGNDTLRFDGSGLLLDLTTFADNRLLGIEQINITGIGDNTLTLNQREVLNLSDESNTLVVFRDSGDVVNIGIGWTQGANETIGPRSFNVYLQGAASLKVQIPNQAPTDLSIASNSVSENVALATTIGNFSTTDPDATDVFAYSLVTGTGDTDNSSFAISGNQLKTNAALDFETKNNYSLRVRTTDAGGLTFEKSLIVNVLDVNEAPEVTRSQSNVDGNVLSTLTNTGTWSDPEGNTVTLSASLGTVVKNANGTWDWSYTPTAKMVNQDVTITANDGTNSSSVSFAINASVAISQRGLFYGGATGSSASTSLATDKTPLLPGQSSTFVNYTNYSRGLNGVVVDVAGLPASTTEVEMQASLQFAQWDGIWATGFTALSGAAVPAVSILSGSGEGGSTRVRITFPDNTVQNTWLRVTVVANAQTGLAANDVFYYGNVIGDVDVGNTTARIRVNALDTSAVRNNQSTGANSVGVTSVYDINRDGRVNALDTSLVRNNQQTSGIVAPITAPSAFGRAGNGALGGEGEVSLGSGPMPSSVPNVVPNSEAKAIDLVPAIGPRWTGENYNVHYPEGEDGSLKQSTTIAATVQQSIFAKKKRSEVEIRFQQVDDYFASIDLERDVIDVG